MTARKPSGKGRRLLLGTSVFLLLTALGRGGSPARAQSIDDDDEPVVVAPQQLHYLVNEAMFNRMVYGNWTPETARNKLDSLLNLKIATVEKNSSISRAQKERIALAGRGDIKSIFDRIDDKKGVLDKQVDPLEYRKLTQELRPLQNLWQKDPFGEGSYFSKALKAALDEAQSERITDLDDEAKRRGHLARIDQVVVALDTLLGLTAEQRRRLTELLTEETQPPAVFGTHDFHVILYQMARLPETKVRPIFDDPQWHTLRGPFLQAKAMKPFLVSNGYLAADAADGPVPDPGRKPLVPGNDRASVPERRR
jgi:hypothetical protein